MSTRDATPDGEAGQGENLRVEIHTGEYIVLGILCTRHQRLRDVLENLTSPYMHLENARVQFLTRSSARGPVPVDALLVSPEHIRIAIPYEESDAPAARASHPQYVPKYPVPARLFLDIMEIRGNLHIREGEDAFHTVQNLSEPFLAVTEASVYYSDTRHSLPFKCPVVIVNRRFVNLIALQPKQNEAMDSRLGSLLARSGSLASRMIRAPSMST